MKKSALFLLPALLVSAILLRAESVQIGVTVPDLPLQQQGHGLTTIPVFSGTTAKLCLAVEAPLGTKLTIKADLMQIARGLAAPLARDVPIAEALPFADRTHRIIEAPLAVPDVQRITQILIRLSARSADNDKWQAL